MTKLRTVAFALAAILAMGAGGKEGKEAPKIGDVVPDQTLTTLDGKSVKLADYRNDEKGEGGKIVVLTFWSYKCPTGKRMMEANEELAEYCKEKDVVFLGIASYGEPKEKVKEYCDDEEVSYSVAHDTDQAVAQALGAQFVSTTMILDKDGKLAYNGSLVSKQKDDKTGEQVPHAKNALEELVAGKAVTKSETTTYG